jgi:hypothetical protein
LSFIAWFSEEEILFPVAGTLARRHSRTKAGARAQGEPMLSFLFGGGWWTPWYLFMWFWLVPAAFVFHYFTTFVPGAGPQGGEAIFAVMMLIWIAFLFIFLFNAVVWAYGTPHSFVYRWLRTPGLAFLA